MPNMDVRHMFAATSLMLRVCRRLSAEMSFVWADITLPTSTNHQLNTGTTQICHQSFLIPQSWLETLTAIIQTGDIRRLIWTGSLCKSGHWTVTICCCTTPSNVARSTPQHDYSPDLCWISTTVGHSVCGSWWLPAQSAPTFSYSHWPPTSHHQRSPTQKIELQESWLYSRHRTFYSADSCQ